MARGLVDGVTHKVPISHRLPPLLGKGMGLTECYLFSFKVEPHQNKETLIFLDECMNAHLKIQSIHRKSEVQ